MTKKVINKSTSKRPRKPVPRLTTLRRKAKRQGWDKWIRSSHDEKALLNGCVFHEPAADFVVNFIRKYCRHSKGIWAGQQFDLLDWQRDEVIKPLFGWLRADGTRRFRQSHVEVPKKNGKSTLAAALGLYMLCADCEPGSEVYAAATKRDQARIVFAEACSMVRKSPHLAQDLRVVESTSRIIYPNESARWEVLASDSRGAEGINPHCVIADELHVWSGRKFWDALRYGSAVRSQPLFFTITTAGLRDTTTIGWQEHSYARSWLAGDVEDQEYYAVMYSADESDNPNDPAVHKGSNPSYGTIIQPEEMAKAAKKAVQKRSELGPFLRYRLNIWTTQADSFFDMGAWRDCAGHVNEDALVGRTCFAGLDMASKVDIAAWVLVFPPDDEDGTDEWIVLPRFFVPEETAERREADDGVQYATWGRMGHVTLTDGNVIDYRAVMNKIKSDSARFDIQSVGADPWNLEYMRQQLADELPELDVVEFGQSFRFMSEPTKKLESLVISKQMAHGGHPVLEWMASNSAPREDNNSNIRIDRKRSRDKIDGIVALVMAIGRAMVNELGQGSIYDEMGVMAV